MALNQVPQPGSSLGSTRNQILNNFSVIDAAFSVNHVPYNDGTGNQGKHAFIQFPVEASVPGGIIAGDVSLYNKQPASPFPLTGVNELFLVKSDGVTQIPITASAQSTNGWSYLPSGVLMKWGTTTRINASEPFAYLYPTSITIPAFQNVFMVQLTVVDNNTPFNTVVTLQTGTVNATGFSVIYNGTPPNSTVVSYLAIGN